MTIAHAAVSRAEVAYHNFEVAMMAFRVELMRHNREGQEVESGLALESLGEYLDQLMIANRE
jgi:hypothetical protein